jgi:hypothetical protein
VVQIRVCPLAFTPTLERRHAMSAEAIVGIVAIVLAALGTLIGATWWMSSLYAEVKSIGSKLCEIHETLVKDISDVRHRQDEHHLQIGELRGRVRALEQNADTELSEE